jgi:Transcription factor S-II (TFIIS), central domain/PHD-finger
MGEVVDDGPFCICQGPDDGTPMVACDSCDEWYHLSCIGVDYNRAKEISEYVCMMCQTKQENAGAGKGDTRGGKSQAKSKKRQAASGAAGESEPPTKRAKKQLSLAGHVDEKMRSYVKTNLQTIFANVDAPEGKDADSALTLAEEVENALHALHREEELAQKHYATKFRSLYFNLKDENNYDSLLRRVLVGELLPADLVAMSTQDLANPELAHEREAAAKASLARVLKTGDGDEEDGPGRVGVYGMSVGGADETPVPPSAAPDEAAADAIGDGGKPGETDDQVDGNDSEEDPFSNKIGAIVIPSFSDFVPDEPELEDGAEAPDDFDSSAVMPPRTPDAEALDGEDDEDPADVICAAGYPRPIWSGEVKSAAAGRINGHLIHLGGPPVEGMAGTPNSTGINTISQVGRMPLEKLNKFLSDVSATSTSRKLSIALLMPQLDAGSVGAASDGSPRSIMEGASSSDKSLFSRFFSSLQSAQRAAVLKCEKGSTIKEAFVVPIPKGSKGRSSIPPWAASAMDPSFICVTPDPVLGDDTDSADPSEAFLKDDALICVFLSDRDKREKRAIMKLMSREREDEDAGRPLSLGSRRRLRVLGVLRSAKARAQTSAKASAKVSERPTGKPRGSQPPSSSTAPAVTPLPMANPGSAASKLFAALSGAPAAPSSTPASGTDAVNLLSQLKSLAATGFQPAQGGPPSWTGGQEQQRAPSGFPPSGFPPSGIPPAGMPPSGYGGPPRQEGFEDRRGYGGGGRGYDEQRGYGDSGRPGSGGGGWNQQHDSRGGYRQQDRRW